MSEIETLRQELKESKEAYQAAHSELVRMSEQLGASRQQTNEIMECLKDLLTCHDGPRRHREKARELIAKYDRKPKTNESGE